MGRRSSTLERQVHRFGDCAWHRTARCRRINVALHSIVKGGSRQSDEPNTYHLVPAAVSCSKKSPDENRAPKSTISYHFLECRQNNIEGLYTLAARRQVYAITLLSTNRRQSDNGSTPNAAAAIMVVALLPQALLFRQKGSASTPARTQHEWWNGKRVYI